jgi:hypothetical protein
MLAIAVATAEVPDVQELPGSEYTLRIGLAEYTQT